MRMFEVQLFDRLGKLLCSLPYHAIRNGEVAAFARALRDRTAGAAVYRFAEV